MTFCFPSTLVLRRRRICCHGQLIFPSNVAEVRQRDEGRESRKRWSDGGAEGTLTNWKFVFSPETSDMMGNGDGCCLLHVDEFNGFG
jgi:hypothetical protein